MWCPSGIILCVLYRKYFPTANGSYAAEWFLKRVATPCSGRNFQESLSGIRGVLDTMVDPGLRGERVLSMERTFSMSKGGVVDGVDCVGSVTSVLCIM